MHYMNDNKFKTRSQGMKTKLISLVVATIISGGCAATNNDTTGTQNRVDQSDLIQELALHDAVRAKDLTQVKALVENKSQINHKDQYGYTPLHIAVRLNQYEITEYLIQNGATVNSLDQYGDTPLIDSTRDDYTELSKLLLCNGANKDVKDRYDISPLHYSSKNSNELISNMILADNLDPYCKEQPVKEVAETIDEEPEVQENITEQVETNTENLTLAESPAFQGLYEALNDEFKDHFGSWQAELTPDDLQFRFNTPAAIFNVGDSSLKEGFTDILTDFFPRYLKVLNKYKEQIQEIRIEGHTSSEYSSATSDTQRYELNKKLSQQRAKSVADYTYKLAQEDPNIDQEWVETTFNSYGMSYDDLIYNPDGTENKVASRRVDFKIVQKEQ